MKDIVVAIDFSKGSIRSFEYAIELATLTKANITLVWVDNVNQNEPALTNQAKELRNEAKQNFDELLENYKDKLEGIKVSCKTRKGKVFHELATYLKQSDCYVLIVGAHGTSGFEDYWIGSNTLRIISSVQNPVITVKYNYDIKRGFRKILLPIDHTPQTLHKVEFVANFARITGADVNILAFNTSQLKSMQKVIDDNVAKAKKQLEKVGVNCIIDLIATNNVAADILHHARAIDADLIAIRTRTDDSSNTVLLGPYAQQLVNYSPVPVLSIHPKTNSTVN